MLLFRARGSGESPGSNKLGGWTAATGNALITAGWRVRDMQADYSAPGVPLWPVALAAFSGNPVAVANAFVSLKRFRDAAKNSSPSVRDTLVAAYNRCPKRKIMIAGYSQGAILLRYVVPGLPLAVRKQVMVVDLVADPTEQGSIDNAMHHSGPYDLRWTREGIDTVFGRGLGLRRSFTQTPYPSDIATRSYQYCKPYDIVCDANPVNAPAGVREGPRHGSYEWQNIGKAAAAYANARRPW